MALTLNNRAGSDAQVVWGMGDSITEGGAAMGESPGEWGYLNAPGGFFDQLTPLFAAKTGPVAAQRQATQSGTLSRSGVGFPGSIAPVSCKPATFSFKGMGGSQAVNVTNWQAGHPEQINDAFWAPFAPPKNATLVVVEWAINDYVEIQLGLYPPSTQLAAYGAILDRIHRDNPLAMVLCMGCLFINQAWSSSGGNHFTGQPSIPGSNPFDLTNSVDTNIAIACAARPGWTEYVSQLDWTLAYTVATTVEPGPNPGAGWPGNLSMNGLHPTLLCQQLMGTHMIAHLNIVTT